MAPGVRKTYIKKYRDNIAKIIDILKDDTNGEEIAKTMMAEIKEEAGLVPVMADDNGYTEKEAEKPQQKKRSRKQKQSAEKPQESVPVQEEVETPVVETPQETVAAPEKEQTEKKPKAKRERIKKGQQKPSENAEPVKPEEMQEVQEPQPQKQPQQQQKQKNRNKDRKHNQEKYGDLYNLEATPAESTSYRLAKHDRAQFPDIITASENGTPYYTNSSHLPVSYTADIFEALDIQDELQTLYTSGTVFHAFLGEKLPDWKAAANLVRKIAENYRLPYYTMSPTYSVCKNHGYISGEEYTCPECGEKTEVYSRITGYYRPVQNFNDGKAQEFKDRRVYDIIHSSYEKAERTVEVLLSQLPETGREKWIEIDSILLHFNWGISFSYPLPR